MPSGREVTKEANDLDKIIKVQIKKVEELTLYTIDLKKENEALKGAGKKMEAQLKNVKAINLSRIRNRETDPELTIDKCILLLRISS